MTSFRLTLFQRASAARVGLLTRPAFRVPNSSDRLGLTQEASIIMLAGIFYSAACGGSTTNWSRRSRYYCASSAFTGEVALRLIAVRRARCFRERGHFKFVCIRAR